MKLDEKWKVRNETLKYLYEVSGQGLLRNPSVQISTAISASQEEVLSALDWLEARELIKGLHSFGGNFMGANITTRGEDLIESGKDVKDLVKNPVSEEANENKTVSITNNISGNINGQQIGDNNTTTVNVNGSEEQILTLITALREAGLLEEAKAVESATDNGKNPNGLMKALGTVSAGLAQAANLTTVASALAAF